MLTYVGISIGRDFKNQSSYTETRELNDSTKQNYYLTLDDSYDNPMNDLEEELEWYIEENAQYLKNVQLTVQVSNDDKAYLKISNKAYGSSMKEARLRAKNMEYAFNQEDTLIKFNDYFTLDIDEKWRKQKIQLVLYIPVGSSIYLDETLADLIYDIPNVTQTLDYDMLNHTWMMTRNGLACLDCTAQEMEGNFEEEWEEEAERQEIEDKYRDLEEQRKEIERLEKMLEKRKDELEKEAGKTSLNSSQLLFLPQNSTINTDLNQMNGYHV